jgi:glycosyltransferase involved in cell wall biosynthesis
MLSVVAVVWNEEKNLPKMLDSVKDLADEIVVVVDEDSEDETEKIAKKYTKKVFTHKHVGIVEPLRNFALKKAIGDWILLLDADEIVSQELRVSIQEIVKKNTADYVLIPRKNIIFGKWITSDHWWPDYVYRLFKKDAIKWDNDIHSQPFTRGEQLKIEATEDLALVHYNYPSIENFIEKLNRYTTAQKEILIRKGYRFLPQDLVIKPLEEFIRQLFARKGYLDGVHGLALAGLQAFSEFVVYLKIWGDEGFFQNPIDPKLVGGLVKGKSREYRWWEYQVQIEKADLFTQIWLKIRRKLGL